MGHGRRNELGLCRLLGGTLLLQLLLRLPLVLQPILHRLLLAHRMIALKLLRLLRPPLAIELPLHLNLLLALQPFLLR
ncbi:MAG TPA: hypothetical protein VNN06_13120, partial [Ramlibacter sp.]|nr:hypothetical protein [Ramlibacter sp.]